MQCIVAVQVLCAIAMAAGSRAAAQDNAQPKEKQKSATAAPATAETPEHRLAQAKWDASRAAFDAVDAEVTPLQAQSDAFNKAIRCAMASFKGCYVPPKVLEAAGCLKTDRRGKSSVIRGCTSLLMNVQGALLPRVNALVAVMTGAAAELRPLGAQLEHVDECLTVYRETIDKKQADITVREGELVKTCQGLNLYPPAR